MWTAAAEDTEASATTADIVTVKGKESDVDAAIAALLALVPETEEVPFPNEFHGNLIGQKGEGIRKIMNDHNVNIKIPNQSENSNNIILKGLRANIDSAKEALSKLLVDFEAGKAVSLTTVSILADVALEALIRLTVHDSFAL